MLAGVLCTYNDVHPVYVCVYLRARWLRSKGEVERGHVYGLDLLLSVAWPPTRERLARQQKNCVAAVASTFRLASNDDALRQERVFFSSSESLALCVSLVLVCKEG